jgi:hypothetical protein
MLAFFSNTMSAASAALLGLWSAAAAGASASSATTATTLDVGVGDDKTAALETINVVDVGSLNQGSAIGIDQNLYTTGVNNDVIIVRVGFKAKDVLAATVATRGESNSKIGVGRTLLIKDLF